MITELIARIFATRNYIHQEHWATTNYARHMALGAFYDDIIEQIDAIVESYQGMYGRVGKIDYQPLQETDVVQHLQEEADWIESNRSEIAAGSPSIENLIDGLTASYSKTLYLLSLK